jgi:hypothetical protein
MVILNDPRIGSQQFIVGPPAYQGVVVVGRLGVVLDKADGDIAIFQDCLVQGFQGSQAVGRGGPPEPLDPGCRVGAPDLAGDVVVDAGGEGLQGTLDFGSLRWNCKLKKIEIIVIFLG